MMIAYLSSDYALPGLKHKSDPFNDEREEAILNNPHTETYLLEDFVNAFNNGDISDQGFIAIINETN